jgi:hypothetical protein
MTMGSNAQVTSHADSQRALASEEMIHIHPLKVEMYNREIAQGSYRNRALRPGLTGWCRRTKAK